MRNRLLITVLIAVMLFATSAFAQTSQTLTLKSGFNFVSFTTSLSLTPTQFKSLSTSIEDVYLFSAAAGSFLSVKDGTLTSLAAGKGYIVKNSSASEISVTIPGGVISAIGSITLKAGFNLVGFSKVPASISFKTIMETYSLIKGIYKWSPAAGGFIQVVRSNEGVVTLLDGADPTFKAGESYFFNLTGDTTINYDGTSIVVGATPVNPNAAPAVIGGTINSAAGMAELGISYQATGEEFDVTLTDFDGNVIPSISLEAGETNPKAVKDGQAYSFKTKDFTKSYKVIAKSKTTTNKMLSTFVGKVKENETVQQRDVTPIATAMSLIYADPNKDASTYKQEEQTKKQDTTFMKKLAPVVADLETKRSASLGNVDFSNPAKLEQAYKDAILGSSNPQEIAKIKDGLDAVIGKLEEQLSVLEKLKDALTLVATSGRRQNETYVRESKTKIKNILTAEAADPLKDTTNKQIYKEAKISYGLVCCDLGDIFKNNLSSMTATGAPNMMAAYQALDGGIDPKAKAEYEEGYNMVKGLTFDETDKQKGLDDAGNAALLKNASELAKNDPAKLDEAKKKADVLMSEMENDGKFEINLPTGEALPKDKILEKKGEALINGGRPTEAVDVFEKVEEPRVKNFGLGRAYLQLNDLEFAYKNLKDSVKDIAKSSKGFENRMNLEAQFGKINEALFAFAAVLDKLKNGTEADVMQIKSKLQSEEQLEGSAEQILDDPNVTLGKLIKDIKPTTSFFAIGKKFADGQTGFGGQFVNITQETDTLKKAFQEASKLMFKANQYIDKARNAATETERKKLIYEGKTTGTLTAPAADTALKYLSEAETAFKAIFDNAAVTGVMKGDAHYHLGLALMAQYRANKALNIENKELISKAKEVFLNIQSVIYDAEYAHLQFAITQMIKTMENFENEAAGVVVDNDSIYKTAEKILERAESLYFDGQTGVAGPEFDKAFAKFDESYKSTDTKITAKMKEAALYYSGYCLFYKFKLMATPDDAVKVKVMERLKLFKLKFPNSEFANAAVDMINDITSNVSTLGPVDASMAKPGVEFSKAISLMEKLRLYYRNNFSTTEIETTFNQAKLIFEAVAVQLSTDVKYIGTFADPKFATALNDFRAHAKFMLAILYMERFAMPAAKDVKYKNLALQFFNELVMNDYTQPFIPDVKNFIAQLKEEIKTEFAEGQPIFTEMFLNSHMFNIDAVKAGTAQLTMTVGVVIPDASGATVSSVKAELKKFGNTVFNDAGAAMKDLALTKVPATATGGPEKWELKLTLPKNLEIAPYDFKVVATTSNSKSAEAYVPFVVEGQATYARIRNVAVTPNGTNVFTVSVSNAPAAAYVNEPGKYTDVYVSVMVQQYGYLMQSLDYSQDIKLTRATATGLDFTLDLAKELPTLKQGSYVFLFKLINYNPADPVTSFMMPVDARPFDFFVQSAVAGADNQIVLNVYNKILANFNSAETPANKVAAFEKMFESALPTEMKNSLNTAFSSVNNLKFTLVGTPFVQYTTNFNGENLVAVFAPWKLSGTYSKDVLNGVILPDGKMILPPGKTGAQIMDFMIDGNFEFAKRYSNGVETWLISLGDGGSNMPMTTEMATITGFAGVNVPADGSPLQVPALSTMPFVKVTGQNLKSYDPDAKRVLRVLGPNLTLPLILSDSGSYEWMGESISFSSEKLKGLKGVYNLEMLDSKYGIIASITLNFMDAGTMPAVSAVLFQITSGQNSSQPFNLIRPFEIDRNFDLILKGDKLKPAAGTYSLRYYNMMSADGTAIPAGSMATMFISFAVSTDAGWTNTMITVPKDMLPSSSSLTDGMPTSIVVWDDAKNMPASSQVSVVFLSQMFDPNAGAQAVINTVNGYDAKATVMVDKKATDTTGYIDVVGSGFASATSRRLDLVLQINGRPVHIPIANNMMTAAATGSNWADNYIKGTLNYSMMIPSMDPTMPAGETLGSAVVKYPCGLLIWDDQLQKQVTPFMVALKFMATTTTTPLITSVNGMTYNGMPVELYAEATEIKVDGQNFGEMSAIGTKGLYLRSQPTPLNPMPTTTMLAVMSWTNTMISATMPAAMQGGIYELFIGDTAQSTGTTAYYPAGGITNVSKIVLINLKSSDTTTTASAFITNINGTSAASTVTIAPGIMALNITGKGFKSMYGTSRMLYMKLKGTNDWRYLADSYMPSWTDTAIMANLPVPEPVGAFEMFIAETDFGASIISNTVYVNFGQSTTGPNITSINGITITPGMMVTLKSDFTSLDIMGMNFGANADKSVIVRFVPFPDPTNPNPAPFEFPASSWTDTIIKVGRPTLAAGVTLMKGNLEMFNKSLNKPVAMPVPVDFTSTTASTIPAVSGLKYDSTTKKLTWYPATSTTSSMMYAYIVNVDGMIYEVPMGVYDFPVNTLMDGEHKAMVQAKIPNTYPAQVGPFSTAVTFTTSGGATSTIPKVTGLMYDPAMKAVKWMPVETATPEGWIQYYVYMVEIDGTVIPNPMTMAEFYVMNLTSGEHKIRVQAQMPGSFPPVSGPFSDAYTFFVEGGTAMAVPDVTGLMYDSAKNALKWNPIDATTTPMPVAYKVEIDAMIYGPFYMNEFFMPPNVAAGTHTARVHAMFDTMPPQFGEWSAAVTFTSVAGTTTGVPNIMTLTYDSMMKKIMWTTDAPATTTGVMYLVALDNNPPLNVGMTEFVLPPAMPEGPHKVTVWAQVFLNNMPTDGTPKMLDFTVGPSTGSLMAPVITYDPATKMLSWSPVTAPVAGSVVEYKIVIDGIQKMMWATPTSLSLNNPTLITNFDVNHTVNVKAVIYSLNMESPLSNTVNTLGGGTTTSAPNILTLTYDSVMRKLMWTTDAAAATTGVTYFVSIDNQTPTPQSMMESYLPATVMDGAHTAMVWSQVMVNNMPVEGVKKSLNFTVGSGTTLPSLVFAPAAIPAGGTSYSGTAPLTVTITAPNLTGVTIKYTMDGVTDPLTPNALTYAVAGISLNIAGTYTIKAIAVDSTGAAKSAPAVMVYNLTTGTTTLPTITGLGYDASNNKLTWTKPSETAYYYYTVEIDNGMTYEAYSMNELSLANVTPALTTGTHTFRVAAKEMGTTTTLGPWSTSFSFTIATTTLPTITFTPGPTGTSYNGSAPLTVYVNVPPELAGMTIKYTWETAADPRFGTVYSSATGIQFNESGSYILKAIVVDANNVAKSQPASAVYNLDGGTANPPAAPTFSPEYILTPGAATTSVTITAPAGAMIKYSKTETYDGSEPGTPADPSTMPEFTSPTTVSITASAKVKIKAISVLNGVSSAVVEKFYNNYQAAAMSDLVFAPATTTITAPTFPYYITISMPVGATSIKYTINSDLVSPFTNALTYATQGIPINAAGNYTIRAVAVDATNIAKSNVTVKSYEVTGSAAQLTAPTFGTTPGQVAPGTSIVINATTGSILYTVSTSYIQGTPPSEPAVPTVATGQTYSSNSIIVAASSIVTIKAVAYDGTNFSTPVVATYSTFTAGGNVPPAPTGFFYMETGKKLVWNPITPPAGGSVVYQVSFDGSSYVNVTTAEYTIPAGTPAGNYTAKIYALVSDGVNPTPMPSMEATTNYQFMP